MVRASQSNPSSTLVRDIQNSSEASHRVLAVFTIQKIAHGLPAGGIPFASSLAALGVHASGGCRTALVRLTAFRTAVGEAGLIRLQLKFFSANGASFNRKSHRGYMIRRSFIYLNRQSQ